MNEKSLTVCYFGIYKISYTRNAINIQGLEQNNVKVIPCNTRERSNRKYWLLIKQYWRVRKDCDIIIVGFPGHTIMPLAWILAKLSNKKIIFDAFVSMYDSMILDRKSHSLYSIAALKYWLIDWLACHLSDNILLDSQAHIDYFVSTFKIKKKKFHRLLVGCDDTLLTPRAEPSNQTFIVHFHGTYIPTQGIPYIIHAAKLLEHEDIAFNIIGHLSAYQKAIALAEKLGLKNIHFIDYLPYDELIDHIAKANICLGMFGDTQKAKRTGAFKIVEAMAMRKAVITADTPAMREVFQNRVHCLFCKTADPSALAEKILELKNNSMLSEKISENGYKIFQQKFTIKEIGGELKKVVESLL